MKKIRVADFFCGCGGTSAGLRAAGFKIVAGIDNDSDAAKTFRTNFPEAKIFPQNIETLRPKHLSGVLARDRSYPLLISACAPCQPFSKQNKSCVKRITRGHDASLLDELHRFINYYLPEYIFIENVPGLQQISERTGPFARLLSLLRRRRFHVAKKIVQSQDYGVPQRRRRLVLIASRIAEISIPDPTHGPGTRNSKYSDVWQWIGDLPKIEAGEKCSTVPNHEARQLSDLNLSRIRATPEGGDRRDWPESLILRCHKKHDGHSDVYGRLWKDRPATALTTKCISLSNGRFGHPEQDRALSVREAACLQTFPRDFVFEGSMGAMAKQIGNAVPFRLAEVFGQDLVRHFRRHTRSRR